MCGRFVITSSPDAIRRLFGYPEQPNMPPCYNIAPTQPVPVVLAERGQRKFTLMHWGFLPAWVKDPKKFGLVINARCESVIDKPAFKNAIRRRRCLVPADGYYEWHNLGTRKRPLFVFPAAGGPIAFAALWEMWTGPNGEELDTIAIVTTAASRDLAAFHPRMPATIGPDAFELWLDCANVTADVATALLIPPRPGTFLWHEVSTAVNRAANDDASLIEPLSADDAARAQAEAEKARPARAKKSSSNDQGSLF